jgi:hypothetical protein
MTVVKLWNQLQLTELQGVKLREPPSTPSMESARGSGNAVAVALHNSTTAQQLVVIPAAREDLPLMAVTGQAASTKRGKTAATKQFEKFLR